MALPVFRYAYVFFSTVMAAKFCTDSCADGSSVTSFGLPIDAPEEASIFLESLKKQSSGNLWPQFEYKNIRTPGSTEKQAFMNMNVSIHSIHFSVDAKSCGDRRVFTATKPEKHNSAVTKVICLFINRNSGGRYGDKLISLNQGSEVGTARALQLEVQSTQPAENTEHVVQVLFFDMLDGCSRKMGVYALRRLRCIQAGKGHCDQESQKPSADVLKECSTEFQAVEEVIKDIGFQEDEQDGRADDFRAVAAGGDGTITWLIDELYKVADPPVKVPVGVIPLGTGNDLSRQVNTPAGTHRCGGAGSANNLVSGNRDLAQLRNFAEVLAKLALAPSAKFDVWNVVVNTHPGGDLLEMRKGNLTSISSRCGNKTGDSRCEEMQQTMGNYASVGFESIIGLEFEKWRSKQKSNSQADNKQKYILLGANYTRSLGTVASREFSFLKYQPLGDSIAALADDPVSFAPKSRLSCDPSRATLFGFGRTYKSLMFMNIECVMGGERKWPNSKYPQPSFEDKTIETLSFRSPFHMGLKAGSDKGRGLVNDNCAVGRYKRPTVTFKENAAMAFQIDGEYYAGWKLKSMSIKHREQVDVIRLGKGHKDGTGSPTSEIGSPTITFN